MRITAIILLALMGADSLFGQTVIQYRYGESVIHQNRFERGFRIFEQQADGELRFEEGPNGFIIHEAPIDGWISEKDQFLSSRELGRPPKGWHPIDMFEDRPFLRAFYEPRTDVLYFRPGWSADDPKRFMKTVLHELGHVLGHRGHGACLPEHPVYEEGIGARIVERLFKPGCKDKLTRLQ